MLTKRQKRSIRRFTCVMTCCVLFSVFLIYTNITNVPEAEPVVFSDILEGAMVLAEDSEEPSVTLDSREMFETMFSAELLTFAYEDLPEYDYDDIHGAGGDLLIDTTKRTSVPEETTKKTKKTTAKTASEIITEHNTTATVNSAVNTKDVTSAPVTYTRSLDDTTKPLTSYTTLYSFDLIPYTFTEESRITTAATTATTSDTTKRLSETAPATTQSDKTAFTNIGGGVFSDDSDVYLKLFTLVNKARKENGLNELWYSARVHEVCKIRATELSSYYSHVRPDGTRFSTAFKEIGIDYAKCGENIAYGRNMFKTPEEIFQAWMDSPSHRDNILCPDYECVAFGLSTLKIGPNTYYYWTQEFATLK